MTRANLSGWSPCARNSSRDGRALQAHGRTGHRTNRRRVALQAHVDPDIIIEAFFLDRWFGSTVTEGMADVIDLLKAVDA